MKNNVRENRHRFEMVCVKYYKERNIYEIFYKLL